MLETQFGELISFSNSILLEVRDDSFYVEHNQFRILPYKNHFLYSFIQTYVTSISTQFYQNPKPIVTILI